MKLKHLIVPALIAGVAFTACKNDLNVLAPYKETLSVYGLLNADDATQKIRINKVFLGAGDATVMAQNPDSINYPAGALTVTLERYKNGHQVAASATSSANVITLTETVVTTNPGDFNTMQRLYITSDKLFKDGDYRLNIKINASAKTFTAQSVIIDSVKPGIAKPFIYNPVTQPQHPFPSTTPLGAYIDYSMTAAQGLKIKFLSIPNARLYDVIMRFHYQDSLTDGTVNYMTADYVFNTVKSATTDGGENLDVAFDAIDFYTNLANVINNRPAVTNLRNRGVGYLEYIIYAGSQDLSDFLQVNAPSATIAQDKPNYSNISDGVGVFASRSRSTLTKDLANVFIDQIAVNHYTCPLHFCNSAGSSNNACQ
jgi:hypothetical protein